MVLWGHVTNSICHTSTCTRPMVTKHGKVVTYCESLLPINSQNPVNMGHVRSRDKLTTFYLHYHNAYGHLTCPSGDLTWGAPIHKLAWLLNEAVRSSDKLNTLHFQLQKTHAYQTRQSAELLWEASTLKTTWPFGHVRKVKPSNNLRHLYLHFHETYGH